MKARGVRFRAVRVRRWGLLDVERCTSPRDHWIGVGVGIMVGIAAIAALLK